MHNVLVTNVFTNRVFDHARSESPRVRQILLRVVYKKFTSRMNYYTGRFHAIFWAIHR